MKKKFSVDLKYIPAISAIVLFFIAYAIGGALYGDRGFLRLRTFTSIFTDNAYLGVSAVGMTLVIISGGIDLSVGSVAALSTMLIAWGTEVLGVDSAVMILLVLLTGTLLGFLMGILIDKFSVPPFISTLIGMFLARGLCFIISIQSITINDPFFRSLGRWKIKLPQNSYINLSVIIYAATLIAGIVIMQRTRFGRGIYAFGGNRQSATLMGLPTSRIQIGIYTFNGFCSALSGILFALYMFSGYGRHLYGMELDVISSVVIGGTLLTGGVGYPIGSLFGIMIYSVILKFISFNGSLSSWWTKIAVGVLLLFFIVMQRVTVVLANRNKRQLRQKTQGRTAP
ncbi:MAG: sugar ABC transporter permease YjfF [Synergistaceae bacterium]|jgi:simple sugar transport system permease protein|nr:sugar ABC transporter permease YjfF [Synergistaceae bacterium]